MIRAAKNKSVAKRATAKVTKKTGTPKVVPPKPKPKPKAKPEEPEALEFGLTYFTRHLKEAVERSDTEGVDAVFGGSVPQIMFRPASMHEDDAEEIPEDKRITIAELRRMSNSYRALTLVGMQFLVSSGEHHVIMKRHPKFPKHVLQAHMNELERRARRKGRSIADAHAMKANMGIREIREFLQLAAANQEIHNEEVLRQNEEIARQNSEIIEVLAGVMEKGVITPELKAAVVRWQLREKREIAEERLKQKQNPRPTAECDLERYEVDN